MYIKSYFTNVFKVLSFLKCWYELTLQQRRYSNFAVMSMIQDVDAKHSLGVFQLEVILDYITCLQSGAIC